MSDQIPSQRHSVWLATGFQVDAATPREAMERAQEWLTNALKGFPLPVEENVGHEFSVTRVSASLTDMAVLAFQLLALEQKGGEAAARVARLRAEIEAQLTKKDSVEGFVPTF